ncbi:MAG: helix-turn-helix domain-containing protein [Oceanicaulis sp.]
MANAHIGSGIDDFLEEEGVRDAFQARAVKEVIAWQLTQAMKERNLSKRQLAALMKTSRNHIDRVLDPENGNVTIETLQRAADFVGRKVEVQLVPR